MFLRSSSTSMASIVPLETFEAPRPNDVTDIADEVGKNRAFL